MANTITDGTTTVAPATVDGYETTNAGRNVKHKILSRPDVDVTLRPASLRAGTLKLLFLTYAAAETCRKMHTANRVLTLASTDIPGIGMQYVLDDAGVSETLDDETRNAWVLEIAYQEVIA